MIRVMWRMSKVHCDSTRDEWHMAITALVIGNHYVVTNCDKSFLRYIMIR